MYVITIAVWLWLLIFQFRKGEGLCQKCADLPEWSGWNVNVEFFRVFAHWLLS